MKSKRTERGLSLREAAKLAGISHVHVKDIEQDKINPSFNKIINLLTAYHADIQNFLAAINILPSLFSVANSNSEECNVEPAYTGKLKSVPVISMVQAGHWQTDLDEFHPDEDEWVESDVGGKDLFAVRVRGDSMEPEFTEGDIIIINPHAATMSGDYVIARNEDGDATLKQLKHYGIVTVLHPLNEKKYQDIVLSEEREYVIVGKVVEKKKRY